MPRPALSFEQKNGSNRMTIFSDIYDQPSSQGLSSSLPNKQCMVAMWYQYYHFLMVEISLPNRIILQTFQNEWLAHFHYRSFQFHKYVPVRLGRLLWNNTQTTTGMIKEFMTKVYFRAKLDFPWPGFILLHLSCNSLLQELYTPLIK